MNDQAPPPDIPPNAFTIERELGRDGLARVYVARDTKHGRRVAPQQLAHAGATLAYRTYVRFIPNVEEVEQAIAVA